MIEYAHTIHSQNEITEHRRLNFKLFYIRLKDKTYTREEFGYVITPWGGFDLPRGKTEHYWLDERKRFSFDAENRINDYQESRKPDLKVVNK